jgi:hypothetical protein
VSLSVQFSVQETKKPKIFLTKVSLGHHPATAICYSNHAKLIQMRRGQTVTVAGLIDRSSFNFAKSIYLICDMVE